MSPLFRIAVAAAAGYIAHRKAASFEATTTGDGDTAPTKVQRFNARGRFFIGLGVAIAVWWALPVIGGKPERSRLGATALRLLKARPDDDGDEDCGCDGT